MKVAVTGATGFVGRHVVRDLLSRPGVTVVASARSEEARADLPNGVRYVRLDMTDVATDPHVALGNPDVVIHLAWNGLPNYRSLHHFETELPVQYAFLRRLVRSGLTSLLVTGTCYEYGLSSGELAETMVARPTNPYGYAKDALREQLEFLSAAHPFSLTWARLFYMHGEGQSQNSLLPQLATAVSRGDASFAMSRGEQLRDYLPVESVAARIADLALRTPGAGIVNVCSGQPISVRTLVEQYLEERGWSIALDLGKYPYPDYEPLAFWGCRKKLDTLLHKSAPSTPPA